MASPSSMIAWRVLWTEEPQSVGPQRVGHDRAAEYASLSASGHLP